MEKYTHFRDKGTGINPFLKTQKKHNPPPHVVLLSFLGKTLLFAIKLPFMLVLLVFIGLFTLADKNKFESKVPAAAIKLLLFLSGFYELGFGNLPKAQLEKNIKNGDIIILNHTSYFDFLLLKALLSPIFVTLGFGSDGAINVEPIKFHKALTKEFLIALNKTNMMKLEELINKVKKLKLGPIVIFPECTTTNGKIMLKHLPILNEVKSKTIAIHVCQISYNDQIVHIRENTLIHFIKVLVQTKNKAELKITFDILKNSQYNKKLSLSENGENLLANCNPKNRIKTSQFDYNAKIEFNKLFYKTNK